MWQTESKYPEQSASGEATIFTNRGKILVGLLVLIGALGYLGFMAFQGATVYYYTVDEMNRLGPTPEDKVVRVSGKLLPDSFHREDGSVVALFALTDGTETLSASHSGVLPDLFFNEHSEIILEGGYGSDGVFRSQNVIVRCPSKYIAEEEAG